MTDAIGVSEDSEGLLSRTEMLSQWEDGASYGD